jgi:hypothetical protein
MSDSVKFTVKSCEKCPNVVSERVYTADSFENCYRYKCSASNYREIGILDTFEHFKHIPKWCPLR